MKKYLLGILAIVLAIGFSAFTTGKQSSSDEGKLNGLYWYFYNGSQITSQVGVTSLIKDDAIVASGCDDDLNQAVCAYGYSSAQSGLPKAPGSPADNIKHTMP